jgi:hypothetical protein
LLAELEVVLAKNSLIFGRECRSGCAAVAIWAEHVLSDSVGSEVPFALRTLSSPKSCFVSWQEPRDHWGWFLGRALVNTSPWPKYHLVSIETDAHLRMLDQIRGANILVVWKLDRLARSTRDLLETMESIRGAGGKISVAF